MVSWWLQNEDFVPGRTIVLSGGDSLSSTSLATLTQGEASVAVMNAMSYSAVLFGNLDFNYGRAVLEQRISESSFGWVGSNILDAATGQVSSLGKAYEMLEVDGVSVAIIGLAEVDSPSTGFGQAMQGLEFAEHVETLQTVVPQARGAGADVVIVVVHECVGSFVPDMTAVTVPAVDAYFALRCGALANPTDSLNGAPLLVAQSNWNDYARLGLRVSLSDGTVSPHDPGLVLVQYASGNPNPVTPSAAVQAVVDTWNDSIAAIISEVIGYTAIGVANPSWELNNFIADSWLASFPDANFALTNNGGIRAGIAPGDITVGEIIDVAPFDNLIFKLTLTGQQLTDSFAAARAGCTIGNVYCPAAIAGFTYTPSPVTLFKSDGSAVDPNTSYTVLVNNFMYFGGSGFDFQALDPTPIDTGVFYRQPAIERLRALGTTNLDPLENHLDAVPRNAGP
ncbi:MAG: hypothetical protein AUK47_14300 [Deltaproteobacteria bacterium CG2_30_63_29]|nr:MAG: hypothetical protein AUK47_14300 [Deltaproteobacteria bacterium CG2_30_63_29]